MIVTVGSTKGGVGKTTLAVNIAVALALQGQDVLLVDGDEQRHSIAFSELRAQARPTLGPGYTSVALHGPAIRTQVRQMKDRYDQVVIDVGGRDTGSLRAALTVSDLVVIPTAPRSLDMWGAQSTAAVVEEMREANPGLHALVLLNSADARGNDNSEVQSALKDVDGLEVSPCIVRRLKAFPNALSRGLGILELPKSDLGVGKAQLDFIAFFESIYKIVKLTRKEKSLDHQEA